MSRWAKTRDINMRTYNIDSAKVQIELKWDSNDEARGVKTCTLPRMGRNGQ